jgi:carbon-monoxide dehydrogenase large subunit
MATPYIGASIKRKEDYRFLTGAGNYTDDLALPRQTHRTPTRRSNRSKRTRR